MAFYGDFVPGREGDLDEFVHNFDTRITGTPTAFGLTAAQATTFNGLVSAWDSAYAVTKNRGTRSASAVIVKNEKKKAMVKNLRALARIVQAFPGTTNEQRSLLGLTVPSDPQWRPAPAASPGFEVMSLSRNTVKVRLYDSARPTRTRPEFARGANVFSHVGATPPTTAEGWFFQGGVTRSRFEIELDPALPMGTKVWFTAFWKNERDQSGPACDPVQVTLLGGGVLPGVAYKASDEPLAKAA